RGPGRRRIRRISRPSRRATARGRLRFREAGSISARPLTQQEHRPMSDVYTPPEVWTYDPENGGQFAGINRPTAGGREERELPVGEHPFQLYSLGTPNGVKATIMFEEL